MDTEWDRRLEYAVLTFAFVVVSGAALVVLEITTIPRFDVGRVTQWSVVGAVLLTFFAVVLPAVLLFGWQSAQRSAREEATRNPDRRRP